MNRIDVRDVRFSYGSKPVLDGVAATCREGEITGILGPNGSGKTTLLRVMSGYLTPDSGGVAYNGRPVQHLRSRDLALMRAVVEQRLVAPFEFSVFDYVMIGRTPHLTWSRPETAGDRHAVEQALELTRTLHLHDRPIGELSGGELQRVMIARALAQEPAFLLLDEPTSHLDVRHQLEIMHLLEDLSGSIAVVAVIHDINHALAFCEQVLLLQQGRVIGQGNPDDILTAPTIRRVFGVDSVRLDHPHLSQSSLAFSLPPRTADERRRRILIIGGGGYARPVIFSLAHAGYELWTGVLNQGDRDLDTALSLGCRTLTIPPFCRIDEAAKDRLRAWCLDADAVVVAAMPVGQGNLGSLEVACEVAGAKPVILVARRQAFGDLDHVGGRAEYLYIALAERAHVVGSTEELLTLLERSIG